MYVLREIDGHYYGGSPLWCRRRVSSRITKTGLVESCRPVLHRVPTFVVLCLRDSFLENKETVSLSLENSSIGIMEPHQKVYGNRKKKKKKKKKTKKKKKRRRRKEEESLDDHVFLHTLFCLSFAPHPLRILLTTVIQISRHHSYKLQHKYFHVY